MTVEERHGILTYESGEQGTQIPTVQQQKSHQGVQAQFGKDPGWNLKCIAEHRQTHCQFVV